MKNIKLLNEFIKTKKKPNYLINIKISDWNETKSNKNKLFNKYVIYE